MELEKEIQESIKKNLPQQVGDVLKQRLEQADKDKEALKAALNLNETQSKRIEKLQSDIDKHNSISDRENQLKEREVILSKGELELKLATVTYQLETEKEKTQFTKEVALGLVRNTVFRKTVFDNENQAPYNIPNNMGGTTMVFPTAISKSLNETETEE